MARRGVKAFGAWCSLPRIVLQTLLHKEPRPKSESFKAKKMSLATPLRVAAEAHCHKVPLADYGDMPHIFRMEDAQVSRSLVLNRNRAVRRSSLNCSQPSNARQCPANSPVAMATSTQPGTASGSSVML